MNETEFPSAVVGLQVVLRVQFFSFACEERGTQYH